MAAAASRARRCARADAGINSARTTPVGCAACRSQLGRSVRQLASTRATKPVSNRSSTSACSSTSMSSAPSRVAGTRRPSAGAAASSATASGCTPRSNSAPPPHPAVRKSPQSGRLAAPAPRGGRAGRARRSGRERPLDDRREGQVLGVDQAVTGRPRRARRHRRGWCTAASRAMTARPGCRARAARRPAWRAGGVATSTTSAPAGRSSYVTGRAPNSLARFDARSGVVTPRP